MSYKHFLVWVSSLDLKVGGQRINLTTSEDSKHMVSFRLVLHAKSQNMGYLGYFGTLWMTLNEELQAQMSASL